MKNFSLIFFVLLATACSKSPPSSSTNAPSAPPAATVQRPPVPPKLTKEEREKLIASATGGLKLDRDKMEKISFYQPKKQDFTNERLSVYLSIPDEHAAMLRIYTHYYGEDWIFFDHIKVMADDEIVYDKQFSSFDMKHENNSAGVFESIDYRADESDITALRKIAAAKESVIRLAGREHQQDFNLTTLEKDNLRNILTAYDALEKL